MKHQISSSSSSSSSLGGARRNASRLVWSGLVVVVSMESFEEFVRMQAYFRKFSFLLLLLLLCTESLCLSLSTPPPWHRRASSDSSPCLSLLSLSLSLSLSHVRSRVLLRPGIFCNPWSFLTSAEGVHVLAFFVPSLPPFFCSSSSGYHCSRRCCSCCSDLQSQVRNVLFGLFFALSLCNRLSLSPCLFSRRWI